jgi:ABC-type polysaccharide/polyol phosphate transport system ATPase subunit/ABC-type polysaccharide/polyol phosphate export permease
MGNRLLALARLEYLNKYGAHLTGMLWQLGVPALLYFAVVATGIKRPAGWSGSTNLFVAILYWNFFREATTAAAHFYSSRFEFFRSVPVNKNELLAASVLACWVPAFSAAFLALVGSYGLGFIDTTVLAENIALGLITLILTYAVCVLLARICARRRDLFFGWIALLQVGLLFSPIISNQRFFDVAPRSHLGLLTIVTTCVLAILIWKVSKKRGQTLPLQKIQAMLSAARLSFGKKTVFDSLSLKSEAGDRIWIKGHNGTGKTSLLRLLSGIVTPDSGELQVCGSVFPVLTLRLCQYPDLTARQNAEALALQLGGASFSSPKELEAIANKHARDLSPGEAGRVLLAVYRHLQPMILLWDEVFEHFDQELRSMWIQELEHLKSRGGIFFVCSHSELFLGFDLKPIQIGPVPDA